MPCLPPLLPTSEGGSSLLFQPVTPWQQKQDCLGAVLALLCFLTLGEQSFAQVYTNGQPTPLVVPVSLTVSNGVITVGDQSYTPSATGGVHVVTVQREVDQSQAIPTPVVLRNDTFRDSSSANNYLSGLQGSGNIILLVAFGNYNFNLNEISGNLKGFGATNEFDGLAYPGALTFTGNEGLQYGQAHQGYGNDLHGHLSQDSNANYVFIQPDYVRFDLTTDGTIKIGSQTYRAGGGAGCAVGAGGLNVVVVDRANPQSAPKWYTTYCTNSGQGLDGQSWQNLANDLAPFVSNETVLVFMASYGTPISADFFSYGNASVNAVALQMRQLGGYYETFADLGLQDTYTLVGFAPPPPGNGIPGARNRGREGSSLYPGYTADQHPTGELHGILGRTRRGNWYSPLSSDPTGISNLDLYTFIGQTPAPFPNPATPDEQAALLKISHNLCGDDCSNIRNRYWDTNFAIDAAHTTLEGTTDSGTSCDSEKPQSAFCTMRGQLLTEFIYVSDIQKFSRNLDTLWSQESSYSLLTALDMYERVQNEIQAPSSNSTVSAAENVINTFLAIGGALGGEAAPIFGTLDALFNFGTSLVTDASGNAAASQNTTVDQLHNQIFNTIVAQGSTVGTLFDLIYQDWGRLSMVGQALENAGPGWAWKGETTTSQILVPWGVAVERSFYRSLMTAHFAIGRYTPSDRGGDHLWAAPYYYSTITCPRDCIPANHHPFDGYYPYTYRYDPDSYNDHGYTMINGPTQNLLTDNGAWLGISSTDKFWSDDYYGPPSWDTLNHLFQHLGDDKGGYSTPPLGVYRPEFFQSWEFPRVNCSPSNESGDEGGGCDWRAAAPPPEALPGPLPSLSMRLTRGASNGGQIPVSVLLTNNGTLDHKNVVITNINLRVVAGNGDVSLAQSAPISVGDLAIATSTTLSLTLNVAPGVKKLLLTVSGTMQNGGGTVSKFSQGQVVFP